MFNKYTYIEFYNQRNHDSIEQTEATDKVLNAIIDRMEKNPMSQSECLEVINKHLDCSRWSSHIVNDFWEIWRDNDFGTLLYVEYNTDLFDDYMLIIGLEKDPLNNYIFNLKCND